MLQMCLSVNFLVCVLCLQAIAVAAPVELSQHPVCVGAAGVTQVRSRQLIAGKQEDIKGVCHTYVATHLFYFLARSFFFFWWKVS